jgi:hypothetical protein
VSNKPKRKRGIHTAVVLEPEVLERLRTSKEGVSFEIRERIRRTLEQEEFEAPSRALANAAMVLADEISRQSGTPWHATRKGRQAIVAAFQQLVEELPEPQTNSPEDKFTDDPATLGRAIARLHLFPRDLDLTRHLLDLERLFPRKKP